jgi:hypothetical protein
MPPVDAVANAADSCWGKGFDDDDESPGRPDDIALLYAGAG